VLVLVTRIVSALVLTINLAVMNFGFGQIAGSTPEKTQEPIHTVQSITVQEDMLTNLDNSSLDFGASISREGNDLDPLYEISEQDSRVAQATSASTEPQTQSLLETKPEYEWIDFVASYYTKDEPGMNGKGITSTGTKVKQGRTIAVDPRIIPYGTRVYIEGIGYRTAEDCGGAIKGKRIDIYVDSAKDFPPEGYVKVKLRIVK
jgi:3D (Asp-Asp-Asp) domain-containing protein